MEAYLEMSGTAMSRSALYDGTFGGVVVYEDEAVYAEIEFTGEDEDVFVFGGSSWF